MKLCCMNRHQLKKLFRIDNGEKWKTIELSDNACSATKDASSTIRSIFEHSLRIWERPAETGHRARAVPFSRKRRSV